MKLYPKDIKSPDVVLVLVWPDFWRPCKEGEGKDASVSTAHVALHALEDAPGTMPRLFATLVALGARSLGTQLGSAQGPLPGTLHLCTWVTLSLTASLASLPSLADVATNLFAFPGHDTWFSAVPVLPKAWTNIASLGATPQPRVSVMTVLARALVRGNLVLPRSRWLEPLCPGRNRAALWPLWPQGCVAMLLTFLPLITASSVWQSWSVPAPPARQHHPSAPWLLKEQLVRPGWDRNSPVSLEWRDSRLTLCRLTVNQVTAWTSGQQHKQAFDCSTQELHRWEFQTVLKIFHGISWFEDLSKGKICVLLRWLAP